MCFGGRPGTNGLAIREGGPKQVVSSRGICPLLFQTGKG